MPTYEYVCEKCGHEFEKFQSIADKPLKTCPEDLCGQKKWGRGKVKKTIGAGAGLIFKGSGFYITDYRSENYKEAAKKDSAAAKPAASESKTPAAGDSKPAAKAESKPSKSGRKD
jgi:putative FmdB family regulatory protein